MLTYSTAMLLVIPSTYPSKHMELAGERCRRAGGEIGPELAVGPASDPGPAVGLAAPGPGLTVPFLIDMFLAGGSLS